MTRILVAYDFSTAAKAALHYAHQMFPEAALCLVHALPPPVSQAQLAMDAGQVIPLPPLEDLLAASERELLSLGRQLGHQGAVSARVAAGQADDVVLQTAADFNPDLLAVGTHGRGGLARLVLGSVAEKIIRRARVPVLVVNAAVTPAEPR